MAVRSVVLFLGDLTAVGNSPVSELAGINPAYDDVQADAQIWNPTAGAWQALQAGVNTNPNVPTPSDRWSFEARAREGLRSIKPTGTLYFIKHAADSTLAATSTKAHWSPQFSASMVAGALAQVTAAAVAANGAGDSLSIDGVVLSVITDDYKIANAQQPYGSSVLALLASLKTSLAAIPHCSVGRLAAGSAFAVVVEPAYKVTGVSDENMLFLHQCRAGIFYAEQDSLNDMTVLRTASYGMAADNKTFSAASMIAIGERLGASFMRTIPTFGSTDAPMVMLIGDSITEGTGFNVQLPSHLTGALPGANIWNFRNGSFGSLQAGVNNQVTINPAAGVHGVEIKLADYLRSTFTQFWMVKTTWVGSRAFMWDPRAERFFWNGLVRAWMLNAFDAMAAAGLKPNLRLASVFLGTNDILDYTVDLKSTKSSLDYIVESIQTLFTSVGLTTEQAIFVLGLPAETVSNNTQRVATVRDDVTSLVETAANRRLVDLNGVSTVGDGIHPDTAGSALFAKRIFDAFKETSSLGVEPLFALNRDTLLRALRLSAVRVENDASTMIDAAIQDTRVGFLQYLGREKVDMLASMPFSANPTTDTEHLRLLAYQTEIKWVRAKLIRTMPMLFMDGTARVQAWQDEAAFRETSYLQTRDELKRLEEEIAQNLSTLKASNLSSTGGRVTMSVIAVENTISPGDTTFKVV